MKDDKNELALKKEKEGKPLQNQRETKDSASLKESLTLTNGHRKGA